jgi:hypothetical protein
MSNDLLTAFMRWKINRVEDFITHLPEPLQGSLRACEREALGALNDLTAEFLGRDGKSASQSGATKLHRVNIE